MANTNFKVFNEANTEANTYNDSEYTNATQRLNGVIPGMAISRMHNKMFRQWSVMAAAIGQYIASSGYNCVDNDLAGIVDALGKVTGVNIRKDSTAYSLGSVAFCGNLTSGLYLECTTAGTTDNSIPTAMASAAENNTVTDGTVTWTVRKMASTEDIKKYTGGIRQKSTAYALGDCAGLSSLPAEWYLECTTAGTTTASDLVITSPTVGDTVADGSVVWTIRKTASTAQIANYLPLAGGTLNGNLIIGANKFIFGEDRTRDIQIWGGPGVYTGGSLILYGNNRSDEFNGVAQLRTVFDGNDKSLLCYPDGALKWAGANVLTDANGGYLPLGGGALTGNEIRRNIDSSGIDLIGATDPYKGGWLVLRGIDSSSGGLFALYATDGNVRKGFIGRADGTLEWNNNDLGGSAIVAKNLGATGYSKRADGLIEQWGQTTAPATVSDNVPVTFPITFPNAVSSVVITSEGNLTEGNSPMSYTQVIDVTNSGFKYRSFFNSPGEIKKYWRAIGY